MVEINTYAIGTIATYNNNRNARVLCTAYELIGNVIVSERFFVNYQNIGYFKINKLKYRRLALKR